MRLFASVLGWALANAIVGGVAFAVVGAFCGALTGFSLDIASNGALNGAFDLAAYGAIVGVACGILSVPVHGFYALFAPPDEFLQPCFDLIPRLAFGQLWGTIIALTGFFALELVSSQTHTISFALKVREDGLLIILFAPALMILGAIAAAIFKRD